MRRSALSLALYSAIAVLFATSGCASAFMAGSEPSKVPPADPEVVYTSGVCEDLTNGSSVNAEGISYYLEPGGAALQEFAKGNGARITNHWAAADGEHYFTYVRTAHGYEIVIPADRGPQATRFVYLKGTFKAQTIDGTLRPSGEPRFKCPLARQ